MSEPERVMSLWQRLSKMPVTVKVTDTGGEEVLNAVITMWIYPKKR